jgi:histone H3/H4
MTWKARAAENRWAIVGLRGTCSTRRELAATPAAMPDSDTWRVCSTCRSPIAFEQKYYACSVSTCNRKRTAMYFCSVDCFAAHVPEQRHRDAWAEERRAPTRSALERAEREAAQASPPRERARPVAEQRAVAAPRRIVSDAELPRDVLVVVSKLKAYVKARSDMSTSDNVVGVLSDHLRSLCRAAIRKAAEDGRKTVMDRDFARVVLPGDRGE